MNAQENLALVIRQSGDQKNNSARLIEESNRQADAVVAFLTSDEVVLSAASAMADLSSDRPEASWADLWLAGVAALGVESPPLDPVSEAELICGDYPAPCNHNPAHKKGAE